MKMKEAGVSDGVIAAILNSKVAQSDIALPRQLRIEDNSKVFIAPMESKLDEFIAAEIVKQKVPVEIVVEERDADYVLTGFSQRTEVRWYDVVSGSIVGGKDRLEASAKLIRVKDKTFIWAGESGDRSLIFGALKRGGQRKLAERIVAKLKQDLF
jgi:TolB-like protein